MKRFLLSLVILCMLLSIFTGCNNKQDTDISDSGETSAQDSEQNSNSSEEEIQTSEPEDADTDVDEPEDSEESTTSSENPETNTTGTTVISIQSDGQNSVTESGSFTATEGQILSLQVASDIAGGTIDLFLFDPNNQENRFTFANGPQNEEIVLSAGTWAYNCTGFFESGSVTITAELK